MVTIQRGKQKIKKAHDDETPLASWKSIDLLLFTKKNTKTSGRWIQAKLYKNENT